MNVAVLGASDKPDRFSYQAVKLLQEKGHKVFPIHQRVKTIDGQEVYKSISDIKEPVDTVTLYVAADISSALANDILSVKPRRIIFNPGAENPELVQLAQAQNVQCVEHCTLVMLNAGEF